jgi:DNA-binding transcriptional LysR family regulator
MIPQVPGSVDERAIIRDISYPAASHSRSRKIPDMLIRQLEYLVTLAREKHFARAAAVCCVSQPALSAGIRHLEEELGVGIVQRGQRYLGLSPEGERILEWAKQTLAAWEGLRQEASVARAHIQGKLRLGAIPTTIPIVPFLTGPFRSAYPDMHQLVKSLSSDDIIRDLDSFELDLGLTYLEDQRLEGFRVWPLFRERYVLLARNAESIGKRAQLSWTDAAKLPLCLLTENMQNRRIITAAFRRAKAEPQRGDRDRLHVRAVLARAVRRSSSASCRTACCVCWICGTN